MLHAHWHNGLAIEILVEQLHTTIEQTCFEINICRQFAFCEQLGLSGLCTALHSIYTCFHAQYLIPHSHCYVLCFDTRMTGMDMASGWLIGCSLQTKSVCWHWHQPWYGGGSAPLGHPNMPPTAPPPATGNSENQWTENPSLYICP